VPRLACKPCSSGDAKTRLDKPAVAPSEIVVGARHAVPLRKGARYLPDLVFLGLSGVSGASGLSLMTSSGFLGWSEPGGPLPAEPGCASTYILRPSLTDVEVNARADREGLVRAFAAGLPLAAVIGGQQKDARTALLVFARRSTRS